MENLIAVDRQAKSSKRSFASIDASLYFTKQSKEYPCKIPNSTINFGSKQKHKDLNTLSYPYFLYDDLIFIILIPVSIMPEAVCVIIKLSIFIIKKIKHYIFY